MSDHDEHVSDVQAHFFGGPAWDDDEPEAVADEPSGEEAAEDDVEGHAGGGFNRPE